MPLTSTQPKKLEAEDGEPSIGQHKIIKDLERSQNYRKIVLSWTYLYRPISASLEN